MKNPWLTAAESNDADYSQHTFDFVQQLELPTHTREVGPLYFLVKYRVQLFGVVEEAWHKQSNYLFGEQHSIGLDGKKSTWPKQCVLHASPLPGDNRNSQESFAPACR